MREDVTQVRRDCRCSDERFEQIIAALCGPGMRVIYEDGKVYISRISA